MHVNHKLKFTVNFYMVKDSICMLQIFDKIWRRVKLSSKVFLFLYNSKVFLFLYNHFVHTS